MMTIEEIKQKAESMFLAKEEINAFMLGYTMGESNAIGEAKEIVASVFNQYASSTKEEKV